MLKTSSDGSYQVDIAKNGAIKVRLGDRLSKYSGALHNNDVFQIHEYARMDKSGRLVAIKGIGNREPVLRVTETVYHLPTYRAWLRANARTARPVTVITFDKPMEIVGDRGRPMEIVGERVPQMSEDEKKQIVLDLVTSDYGWPGEWNKYFIEVGHWVHTATDLLEVAEILWSIFKHAPEVLEKAAGPAGPVGWVVLDMAAVIQIVDALERGERLIGMRAAAYGITSWAFGDQPPTPPAWIRTNILPVDPRTAGQVSSSIAAGRMRKAAEWGEDQVRAHQRAWNSACKAAWKNMDESVAKLKTRKENRQAVIRSLGGWDRNRVVTKLMEGIAKKYIDDERDLKLFWAPEPNYPSS